MVKDNYIQHLIGKIMCSSIRHLFDNQPDIFDFTPQTGETEWNLGHHLANEIHKFIFWLDCDIDLVKRNYRNRRPDIVFHKRGINSLNFLVVELKHRGEDDSRDIEKIRNYWMGNKLHYRFGASIRITDKAKYTVTMISRNNEDKIFDANSTSLAVCEIPGSKQKPFFDFVDKIFALTISEDYLENSTKKDQVQEYEHQIDQLVFDLYGLTEEEIAVVEGSLKKN